MDRRQLLKSAALTALGAAVSPACAVRQFVVTGPEPRRYARVRVSPDRIIRTIAGLRPFRPSGFVVRAEKAGEKLLVHNYGHGGGGISLSWGTSVLAVEQGWQSAPSTCAVVGCGVIGLATALLLQRRGARVTIYARDVPPNTTSNVAGGQWSPFSVFDRGMTTPEFDTQFDRAARIAQRTFQPMAGVRYGVRWIENLALSDEPHRPGPLDDLMRDARQLGPGQHPFPFKYAFSFATMLIEPHTYLNALTGDFLLAGGRLAVRDFASRDEILTLPEPVIFNCTGLGARSLFGDAELIPVKGQLTFLLPQPEVDYITLGGGLYMFPRSDGVLLGGTFERGNWSIEPDREAEQRIVRGHQQFFDAMR